MGRWVASTGRVDAIACTVVLDLLRSLIRLSDVAT